MHMADALLSPTIGGTMCVVAAAATAHCARRVQSELDDRKVPLMGAVGAFIFAAQMVNFTIPGTGSSGHLGGGLILSILLGPHAAFLVMASVLAVQALFFADGGLLALGANVCNLGIFPCFVAYPLIYRPLARGNRSHGRIVLASLVACIVALQLGAFSVVIQTTLSGIFELPFSSFLMLMQPIHLGIGVVEGLATAGVVNFLMRAQPEILLADSGSETREGASMFRASLAFLATALLVGGGLSLFASSLPDGLEWSIAGVTGAEELPQTDSSLHETLGRVQEKVAVLPDYGLKTSGVARSAGDEHAWPRSVDQGTVISGIAGSVLTMAIMLVIGRLLRQRAVANRPR